MEMVIGNNVSLPFLPANEFVSFSDPRKAYVSQHGALQEPLTLPSTMLPELQKSRNTFRCTISTVKNS